MTSELAQPHSRFTGQVRVVGAGLLGCSVGLGLRAVGVEVILADSSPGHLSLAVDYGAGRTEQPKDDPQLIVVCVPPDVAARVVADELLRYPNATVTDVASVKMLLRTELQNAGADLSRYCGSHPLAGRERGGPSAGRADLFRGRPWVITAEPDFPAHRRALLDALLLDLGAIAVTMTPEEHDTSVALISHLPQIMAALTAKQLCDAPVSAVNLAGQGLRDVTRIAASDPELWVQILQANAHPVSALLHALRADLDAVIAALDAPNAPGSRRTLAEELRAANRGVNRIPGKHGHDQNYAHLTVMVDDVPGELARLFSDIGMAGVNLEDLRLEHSPGAQIGLAEISVLPGALAGLTEWLGARGWKIAG